ncbi:hypothetical protein HYFRA_00009857 [Hymenoscyphus fraxineus]|uniref:Uncharacterized protein n=1 Tax=Hymenoscyphus fraxineus TaxID=746836 RepID=A0A9N9L7R8_9HELO|nr:hypothetical protein HYFRA_00009857 [Hymenoscyphus fraxineus]
MYAVWQGGLTPSWLMSAKFFLFQYLPLNVVVELVLIMFVPRSLMQVDGRLCMRAGRLEKTFENVASKLGWNGFSLDVAINFIVHGHQVHHRPLNRSPDARVALQVSSDPRYFGQFLDRCVPELDFPYINKPELFIVRRY